MTYKGIIMKYYSKKLENNTHVQAGLCLRTLAPF